MSDTYSSVDDSDDVAGAIAWQERNDGWPAVAAYKAHMDALVGDLRPVVDVGCGPGLDAARLGGVGVDASTAMASTTRGRGVAVAVGDAARLPLRDGCAGAVWCDRVLQHLLDPVAALRELVRVVRPGGRVVVCDPDQQTLAIHVPGVPVDLVDRVRRLRRDVGYRNGRLVTRLPDLLPGLGLVDVTIDAFPLVLRDPDDAFGLPTWVDHWRDAGGFTDADAALWRDRVAASAGAGFVYAVTYFVVAGTRR